MALVALGCAVEGARRSGVLRGGLSVLLGSPAMGQEVPPPEEAEHTKFMLKGIVVEGSTVYRRADFIPLYKSLLGKEVSLADIHRVARAITAMYRRDGYILSQAIVPPQTIVEERPILGRAHWLATDDHD